ncbi:MAG: type II toxin-antitoxin system HicA family toxin [Gemmataceae bacterium]|nr:type II toxin-antitoxin system HicA family toxin [Gemmataceae bacterium]
MGKHSKTLEAVFAKPTKANIDWREIEEMLKHYGAEISEGRGSRVRVHLRGFRATFHRPHPQKEAGKATVKDLRDFLENAGVIP